MKEDVLRGMIRKQIKSSLKEADITPGQSVTSTLGRVEKMAGVKMLKKALGQGGVQQQAAGLHAVVKAISGDSPQVARMLARMLMKKGIDTPEPGETDPTPNVQEAKVSSALSSRMGRVDKTQAMVMMKKMLDTKPATMQADFVLDLLKGLNLKKSAKQRLFIKMRKELGGKE
jgi:hypothetical protein